MKRYAIIFFFSLVLIQTNSICMELMDRSEWIVMSSSGESMPSKLAGRPIQPLPQFSADTIKKLYKSIENSDDRQCKRIVIEDPGIVHVCYDHMIMLHELKQATPLHIAAYVKNPYAVKLLLKSGADCNKGTIDGRTPLHVAGNKRIAKILVENGKAAIDQKDCNGETPLWAAVCNFWRERLDVAHYLIKHGANINHRNDSDGGTLLHEVISSGYNRIPKVIFLLTRGADTYVRNLHGKTAFDLIFWNNFELMKLFVPVKCKRESFFIFAHVLEHDDINNFEKLLTTLLDYEPDFGGTDGYGNTLLHKAILSRRPKAIAFLVRHNHLPFAGNNEGKTILDLAYESEDQPCIQALNKAVFDKFFCTPCYAQGYREIKTFLKYAFASPYRERFVRGIVHYAALDRAEIAYNQCLPLLKWGAPVNVQSQVGDFPQHDDKYPFPLSWAMKVWDTDLIKLFLNYGAIIHEDMFRFANDIDCYSNSSEIEKVYDRYKKQQEVIMDQNT